MIVELPLDVYKLLNEYPVAKNVTQIHLSKMERYLINNCDVNQWIDAQPFSITNLICYWVLYGDGTKILSIPVCKTCGKIILLEKAKHKNYCCQPCSARDPERLQKAQKTCMERYGDKIPSKTQKIKDKTKATILEKYGAISYTQTNDFKSKSTQTLLKNYGVTNAAKSDVLVSRRIKSRRSTSLKSFNKELSKRNMHFVGGLDEYINVEDVTIFCNTCGREFTIQRKVAQLIYCPYCSETFRSIKEQELVNWLKSMYPGDIILNDRTVLNGKEIDIFLPQDKIGIEFNGSYWHSEYISGRRDYHSQKTELCNDNNIDLIHVFEYEWDTCRDAIKALILSRLGIFEYTLNQNDCDVVDISDSESKQFINRFGLNPIIKTYSLGLTYRGDIICVFGVEDGLMDYIMRPGFKVNCLVDIICSAYKVSSLKYKLDLSHFSLSSIDCEYEIDQQLPPNYVYVNHEKVLPSNLCTKQNILKMFDVQVEDVDYFLTKKNYYKIFDCGCLLLTLRV